MKYPILSDEKTRCQICGKEFSIIGKHLKTHGYKAKQYKLEFPNCPLTSKNMFDKKSLFMTKLNESRKGKKRSEEEKQNISNGIKKSNKENNYVVHNKGKKMPDEQRQQLSLSRKKYFEKLKEEGKDVPWKGHKHSSEIIEKNRKAQLKWIKDNPEKHRDRSEKAKIASKNSNYNKNKKQNTFDKKVKKIKSFGFSKIKIVKDKIITLTCNSCDTTHTRSLDSIIHSNMCPICRITTNSISSHEREFHSFLNDKKIEYIIGDRNTLNGFELDILIPKHNLAIEFNGLYWHSEINGRKSKFYHLTKTKKTNEKNIRLIHIFEDEWVKNKELVKNRILNTLGLNNNYKIYARKCDIKKLTNKDVKDFINKNHIQGHFNSLINLGLFYGNKLVSIMTFSKDHYKNTYELSRFCSESNILVVGAASKLFKYFIKNFDPESVVTYSDLRWNNGNVFEILGFEKIGETLPTYWYVKHLNRYHRYKFTKNKLIDQGYDPEKSEWEIMKELGYDRIWDSGFAKYIWKK